MEGFFIIFSFYCFAVVIFTTFVNMEIITDVLYHSKIAHLHSSELLENG